MKDEEVLLVEDDEATAELERRALVRSGLRVRRAARVSEAVALLQTESFLAVLLDYQLPDGDAWTVLDAANAKVPRIPVIVVTGMGNERVAAEAIHRGIAEYVKKTETFWDQLPGIVGRVARLADAEERLRRTDALFQLVANHTSDVITVLDRDGTIKYVSPGSRNLSGHEPEELVGASRLKFVHPDDREPGSRLFADLAHQGQFTTTYRLRRKDGTYVWVESNYNALRDLITGQITEVVAISRDISERKRAEDAVRKSEVRFRTLFEQSPLSLWEGDFSDVRSYLDELAASGIDDLVSYLRDHPEAVRQAAARIRILQVNTATLKMCEAETLGQLRAGLPQIFAEETFEVFGEEVCAFLQGSTAFHAETVIRPLKGGKTPISFWITILPGYESTWARVVVSVSDFTERIETERRIRASLEEKELLLKEIHHRVKNNLQVISSLLSLQARHLTDSAAQEMFGECQRRVRSIALVHEQLYRSKDLAHVPFQEYVEALVAGLFHTFRAEQRKISHTIDVGGIQLPIDTAIPCGLVISELVTNSLKHAFPRGKSGLIRIVLTHDGTQPSSLVISDDGIGISKDIDPQNTASLGLELVYALGRQLDAEIDVKRDNGTAFQFKFVGRPE